MMITETISNEKQSVFFFAPAEDMKVFDDIAWKEKLSRSELLRRCVAEKIAEYSRKE